MVLTGTMYFFFKVLVARTQNNFSRFPRKFYNWNSKNATHREDEMKRYEVESRKEAMRKLYIS